MGREGLTQRLAAFFSECPENKITAEARHLAMTAIRDAVGVAVAGTREPVGKQAIAYAREVGGKAVSSVFVAGFKTSPMMAAFANGTCAHALDFDDTNHPMYGHPSCHLMPSVFALAQERGIDGRRVISSYIFGFEMEVKLSRGMNLSHYLGGWHATGSLGTMGAAVACGRLLGLDKVRMAHALAIAASEVAGLRQNIGTMTKPLHSGRAALNGVMAACLAEKGFEGSTTALEGVSGLCRTYSGGGDTNWDEIEAGLGDWWEITLPHGLAIKPYPACGATHPSIQACIELKKKHGIEADQIESVDIGGCKLLPPILVYHEPESGTNSKFSLEHAVATAFAMGRVAIEHFDDDFIRQPAIRALWKKVHFTVHPEMEENTEFGAIVTVTLKDGRKLTNTVAIAKGKNSNPMTEEELVEKFNSCAEGSVQRAEADGLVRLLTGMDALPDIAGICRLLATSAR